MRTRRFLTLPVLLLVFAACGRGAPAGAPRPSSNLILADEIQQQHHFRNAYEVVNSLRPHWLQARSQGFGSSARLGVMIYLDNNRLGGQESLRQIVTSSIQSMQYLSAPEATSRYGTNHAAGAILVTTVQQQ
jgi:hypothetical protein